MIFLSICLSVSLSQKQEQTKKAKQINYKKSFEKTKEEWKSSQSEADRVDEREFRHEAQARQGPKGDTPVAMTEESCRGGTTKTGDTRRNWGIVPRWKPTLDRGGKIITESGRENKWQTKEGRQSTKATQRGGAANDTWQRGRRGSKVVTAEWWDAGDIKERSWRRPSEEEVSRGRRGGGN